MEKVTQEFSNNPIGCPRCGKDADVDYENQEYESGCVWQRAECKGCGLEWNEIYTPTEVEIIADPKGEYAIDIPPDDSPETGTTL